MSINLRSGLATSFKRCVQVLGGLLLLVPTSILAQTPLGDVFQINETSFGNQLFPRIAAGPAGFAAVWYESEPGTGPTVPRIQLRNYSASGLPAGSEITIPTPRADFRQNPFIAIAPNGSKLIVWTQTVPEGEVAFRAEVFGTLYDRAGVLVFSERRLNTYEPGDQATAGVAADGNSNFIVVWASSPASTEPQDGSGSGVYARRISSTGRFLGPEFRVNTYTLGDQSPAGVAAARDGKFVIVWDSVEQDGSADGVYGQLFDFRGKRIGPEFQVNQYTTGPQIAGDVAMDRWGDFVVVWQSQGQNGLNDNVYARRYRSDGRPHSGEWSVLSEPVGTAEKPRVAMDSAGNFVIVWRDLSNPATFPGPAARAFYANGKPVGKELGVNTEEFGFEDFPDVALADDGTMMVVWEDNSHETPPNVDNATGLFGRRFVSPFHPR